MPTALTEYEMTSFQILNKTGWFSKPARTVENRYGVSVGDSSVGLHFRKRSFYVFTLYPSTFFKVKTMCEIKLPTNPDCVNIKLDNEPDNGIHDFFLADMSFNVPKHRRNLWITSNIRWLLRNLGIRNSNHPDLEENIQDLKELLNFVENQPKLGDPC